MSSKQKTVGIRISWWLRAIQVVLLMFVKVKDEWLEQVKSAADSGSIVFVLRNRSLMDFLCLEGLAREHNLPRVGFATGISPFLYMPWWCWIWHVAKHRSFAARQEKMRRTLEKDQSVVVFLRKPAPWQAIGSRPVTIDGIKIAAHAAEVLSTPVVALPTVFLWGERSMRRLPSTMDFMFGSNDYPRLLRSLWLIIRHRSVHELIAGTPLNLAEIKKDRHLSSAALIGAIRTGVGRQIEEIRRSRLGTLTKPSSRVKHEVFKSPRLRAELMQIAEESNIPENEVLPRAQSIIHKLAADVKPKVLSFFAVIMALVWKKLYTGIDVDAKSIDHIRRGMAEGASLVLPTHKSHIDYLVVSQILMDHNIMLPHIAAGENLAFWPMGWLFRSSGAFFIRRRFINDRFYTAIVNAYIRRLVQMGYPIEVFIEGGRSRTGKLLRPKQGMVEMTLGAIANMANAPLQVVPISIGYERVIEEGSYVKESEGTSKKNESISGLVKTTKVLLHRYGRLSVRAAEPFSLDSILEKKKLQRKDLSTGNIRRAVAQELALRNLHAIQDITIVSPSSVLSTVLLSTERPTFDQESLIEQAEWLIQFLRKQGAPLSPSLELWQEDNVYDKERRRKTERYIKAFVRAGRIHRTQKGENPHYNIPAGQRLPIDYYKNNIIHFLVPSSLICSSLLGSDTRALSIDQLSNDFSLSCDLYRWEFLLPQESEDTDKNVSTLFDDALILLEQADIIQRKDQQIVIRAEQHAEFLANVLRNYHEIYWAALQTVKIRIKEGVAGDSARKVRSLADQERAKGRFIKPEGHSRINIQNAMSAFKDLRIHRPSGDVDIFGETGLGHKVDQLLTRHLRIN